MIGTELLQGQGLGNQLFCYITTRCIAKELGYEFAILGEETMANNMHSSCGMYFMELDYGIKAEKKDFGQVYTEKEDRIYLGNSRHDMTHGCYITDTDEQLMNIPDQTLLCGNMQAEDYFLQYREEIREWLKVRPEYDTMEYSRDNLCILHVRCSDYLNCPELYLKKKYWITGMKNMRKIRPDMEFMIITNDVKEAGKLLPGIPAYNFDLAKDYAILKNARYLLISNSSFTFFPAFTGTVTDYIIAPKYWARHNVSDGYWASEQNIYSIFHYQDRQGSVFTAEECRRELEDYKKRSAKYRGRNQKPGKVKYVGQVIHSRYIYGKFYAMKVMRGVYRRLRSSMG